MQTLSKIPWPSTFLMRSSSVLPFSSVILVSDSIFTLNSFTLVCFDTGLISTLQSQSESPYPFHSVIKISFKLPFLSIISWKKDTVSSHSLWFGFTVSQLVITISILRCPISFIISFGLAVEVKPSSSDNFLTLSCVRNCLSKSIKKTPFLNARFSRSKKYRIALNTTSFFPFSYSP